MLAKCAFPTRALALAAAVGISATGCGARSQAPRDQVAADAAASASPPGAGGGVNPRETPAPGRYVTDELVGGAGTCAGTALAAVLQAIRTGNPDLSTVTVLYDPAQQGLEDGSFVYAYQRADGGFAVVFKLGSGDCPSGCTDNDYRYFATDDACLPVAVGTFHTSWGSGSCLESQGVPMWDHPPAPDPLIVCGADNAPQDLRGTYTLHAVGTRQACALSADATPVGVDLAVTMIVDQDPNDPGVGTITFQATGHPLVDGTPLPAQIQRRRFDASLQLANLPSACPRTQSVMASYDFEGFQPGRIDVLETGSDACSPCKGFMTATLSAQ